jgi:hypothetical protein
VFDMEIPLWSQVSVDIPNYTRNKKHKKRKVLGCEGTNGNNCMLTQVHIRNFRLTTNIK